MDTLAESVISGAPGAVLAACEVPEEYRAAYIRAKDVEMFKGQEDKDVRQSLHVGDVPMPELAPDEVLIAVMASSMNYNTVWSAKFEPVPTFAFLRALGRQEPWGKRHDLPWRVLGSDAAGVIVRSGIGVHRWRPGDHVLVSPISVDDQDPDTHADGRPGADQRVWGFETNFGGLAHAHARAPS